MNAGARVAYAAVAALLVVLASGLSSMYYFWFFEPPWLTYPLTDQPFPLVDPGVTYYEGDVVPLVVFRCSSRRDNFGYRVTHSFENMDTGQLFILPDEAQVPIKPGCHRDTSLINRLPRTEGDRLAMPPGRYRVVGAGIVAGTLTDRRAEWTSEEFRFAGRRPVSPAP